MKGNSQALATGQGQGQSSRTQQTQQSGKRGGAAVQASSTRVQQQKGPRQQGQGAVGGAGPKISSADFPPLGRNGGADVKHFTREELLALYGRPASSSGVEGDDLSAFESSSVSSAPVAPQFFGESPVITHTVQEPELTKPAPAGAVIMSDLVESVLSKRRSSSSGSQGRPASNPRQRPEVQPTAAQVAAASADKRPPLPPTAASIVAGSGKKTVVTTATAKPATPKPKETKPETKPSVAPVATPAPAAAPKQEPPKSAGPSWSDIAKAQAAAAAAQKAPKPAGKASGSSSPPQASSSISAAPASN